MAGNVEVAVSAESVEAIIRKDKTIRRLELSIGECKVKL